MLTVVYHHTSPQQPAVKRCHNLASSFYMMSLKVDTSPQPLANRKNRQTLTPDWEKVGLDKRATVIFQRTKGEDVTGFHPAQLEFERPIQHFLTGSSYEGTWDSLGFTGYGTYYFPHGAVYNGNFKDGQFHGKGTITYPVGHKLKGVYKNGKLIDKLFVFADGLAVQEPNNYCQMPDRRFQVEFNTSLRGVGEEVLTNSQPTIDVPDGCFDTIDGFYVPSVKCIFKYDEECLRKKTTAQHRRGTDNLKRTTLPEEGKFIENNYRRSALDQLGYRPDLYECWITGRKTEVERAISDLDLRHKLAKHSESLLFETSSELEEIDVEFEILRTK